MERPAIGVDLNPNTNMIYVTSYDQDNPSSLYVVDGSNNAVRTIVTVGFLANGVSVNANTDKIYVANGGARQDGSVSIVDGATREVTSTIPVGQFAFHVAVNPNTNKVYVTHAKRNYVSVIDGISNTMITNISSLPILTDGVAVNPKMNRIYVTGSKQDTNSVLVIDGEKDLLIGNILVGKIPAGIGFNLATNTLYVANSGSLSVSVVNAFTNSIVTDIMLDKAPHGIAVNSNTNNIYVTHSDASDSITIIDGSTNKVLRDVVIGGRPFGIAVNQNTNRIYVTNAASNSLSVLDGSLSASASTSPTGSWVPQLIILATVSVFGVSLAFWMIKKLQPKSTKRQRANLATTSEPHPCFLH